MDPPQFFQGRHRRHLHFCRPELPPFSFAELSSFAGQLLQGCTTRMNACGATPPRTRSCRGFASCTCAKTNRNCGIVNIVSTSRTPVPVNPQWIIIWSSIMLFSIKPVRGTSTVNQHFVFHMTEGKADLFGNHYRVRCRCRSSNLQQNGLGFVKKTIHKHGILASRKHESENTVYPKQNSSIWHIAFEL